MKRTLGYHILVLVAVAHIAAATEIPSGFVILSGDRSIVLHWDPNSQINVAGYRVYRSTTGVGGPFTLQNASLLAAPGFCDLSISVVNGKTNSYYVTAVDTVGNESGQTARTARNTSSG